MECKYRLYDVFSKCFYWDKLYNSSIVLLVHCSVTCSSELTWRSIHGGCIPFYYSSHAVHPCRYARALTSPPSYVQCNYAKCTALRTFIFVTIHREYKHGLIIWWIWFQVSIYHFDRSSSFNLTETLSIIDENFPKSII